VEKEASLKKEEKKADRHGERIGQNALPSLHPSPRARFTTPIRWLETRRQVHNNQCRFSAARPKKIARVKTQSNGDRSTMQL